MFDEVLGVSFVYGGSALIVLEVAQASLGINTGACENGASLQRIGFDCRRLSIHKSHIESRLPSAEAIASLSLIVRVEFIVLASFL